MSTGSFLSYTVPNIIKLMDLSTPILSSDGKAHHLLCNIGDFEVAFEFGLRCVLQVFNVLTYTLHRQPTHHEKLSLPLRGDRWNWSWFAVKVPCSSFQHHILFLKIRDQEAWSHHTQLFKRDLWSESEWVSERLSELANLSVDNEVTLTINHIWNHHYTVVRCIWELERKLGGLNVKGTHSHLCTLQQICSSFQSCLGGLHAHHIPQTTSDICWAAASCTQKIGPISKLNPLYGCLFIQPALFYSITALSDRKKLRKHTCSSTNHCQ